MTCIQKAEWKAYQKNLLENLQLKDVPKQRNGPGCGGVRPVDIRFLRPNQNTAVSPSFVAMLLLFSFYESLGGA